MVGRFRCPTILLLLSVVLTGCTNIATGPVPGYLPYVTADFDLDANLPPRVGRVRAVPLSTDEESYVAMFVRGAPIGSEDAVILYDAGFRPRASQTFGVGEEGIASLELIESALVTSEGSLYLGNLRFTPGSAGSRDSLGNGSAPSTDIYAGTQVGSEFYTLRRDIGGNSLLMESYTASFLISGSNRVEILDEAEELAGDVWAHEYVSPAGERSMVVFAEIPDDRITAISIPASALPSLASPLETSYPSVTVRGTAADRAFRIRAGIVTVDEREELFRRFDPETGAERDSFAPGVGDGTFFDNYVPAFFHSSGEYLLLDMARRRVYEVSQWW